MRLWKDKNYNLEKQVYRNAFLAAYGYYRIRNHGCACQIGINFNELENMEEDKVEKKITELRSLLEEYPNGGFDIIRAKKEAEPNYFFTNENCFIDLLG